MALSNKDREEAFDAGWDAAQRAEEAGEPSLLASLFGQILVIPIELASLLGSDQREEWRQEYEHGYRAYERQSEGRTRDNDASSSGESVTHPESERVSAGTYETSTSYHSNISEATAKVGEGPSKAFTLALSSALIITVAAAVLLLGRYHGAKTTKQTLVTVPDYVSLEHRAVLGTWLGRNPKFRVATDADCPCIDDLPAILQNSNNDHLYYAVEDLDSDGDSDFAVVLIDITKHEAGREFNSALAVFNEPFSEGMNPAFLEEGIGFPVGTLLFRDPDEKQLAVCKWESECSVLFAGSNGYSLESFPGS